MLGISPRKVVLSLQELPKYVGKDEARNTAAYSDGGNS